MSSQSLSSFPCRRHCATLQLNTGASHRSFHQPLAQPSAKRPALLLLAGGDLLPHLARFLGGHGYTIYAATEATTGEAILMKVPIDLVLLHCVPEASYDGWETYTQLRQWTTKPILMVANIAVEHFTLDLEMTEREAADSDLMDRQKRSADLASYLYTITLVCNTMLL